jgi:uncharacterized protein YndB with AHSA1/START domain
MLAADAAVGAAAARRSPPPVCRSNRDNPQVIELERSVTVDRPPDVVFGHLERPEGYASWLPGIRTIRVEGDGDEPIAEGRPLIVEFDGPTGPLAATGSITELSEPSRLAIRAESRELRFDAAFDLSTEGDGLTTIVLHLRLELRGMFRFAERMVAARVPGELAEALQRLKSEIEATPD